MKVVTKFHSSLNHNQPEVFVQSQWQSGTKSLKFVIFRWILAAYFIATVAFSWQRALTRNAFGLWWIYMTDWGILLCMISTTYGAILATRFHKNSIQIHPQSTDYKIYWCLSNIAMVLAFVISIFYYGMLYGGNEILNHDPGETNLNELFNFSKKTRLASRYSRHFSSRRQLACNVCSAVNY